MTIKIGETHILCRRLGGDYFGEHPGSPDLPSSEAVKRLVEAAQRVCDSVYSGKLIAETVDALKAAQELNRAAAPFTENTE